MTLFRCIDCLGDSPLNMISEGVKCEECERIFPLRFGGVDFSDSGRNLDNDAQADIYNGMLGELSNFITPHNLTLTHQRGVLLNHIKPGVHVLEIGGHRSGVLPFLEVSRKASCRGIDVSATWVAEQNRLSRLRGNDTEWTLGDAENLPFKDESFDAVVSFDVFEHLSSVEAAIKEVSRVLRVGGNLVCHMPVADVDWSLDGFQRRFRGTKWRAAQVSVGHYHEKMASRTELLEMFEKAGLDVVESESFNVWVQPWHDHKLLPLLGRIRHRGQGVHERKATKSNEESVATGSSGFQKLYSKTALPIFRLLAMIDKIGVVLNIGGSHSFVVRKRS